jgi:hypothetical protein
MITDSEPISRNSTRFAKCALHAKDYDLPGHRNLVPREISGVLPDQIRPIVSHLNTALKDSRRAEHTFAVFSGARQNHRDLVAIEIKIVQYH